MSNNKLFLFFSSFSSGCDDDDVLCQDPTEEPTDNPTPAPPDTNSPTQTATEYEYDDDDYSAYAYPMYTDVLLYGSLNVGNDITELMTAGWHNLADHYHRFVAVNTLEEYDAGYVCKIEYRAFDGTLYSASDTIEIELLPPPHLPTVDVQSLSLNEDNELVFSILTSNILDPATTVLTVTSLPSDVDADAGLPPGKLFHADGREVTMKSGSSTITQFVSGGTFSSEWDAVGYSFGKLFNRIRLKRSCFV